MTERINNKISNNRLKKTVAKVAAAVLTAVLAVQAVMPVTEVQATTHTANRMLEIPISFQTDQVYVPSTNITSYRTVASTYAGGGTGLKFECSVADFTMDSRLSYKVYIPVSYFENENSMITVEAAPFAYDYDIHSVIVTVGADGAKVYGTIDGAIDLYSPEEAAGQYDSKLSVQMEEEGGFYVISIDTIVDFFDEFSEIYTESVAAGLEDVEVSFGIVIQGFSMDVLDGDVYCDDITITSASGETLFTQDFEDTDEVIKVTLGVHDGSGNRTITKKKKLNIETIYDNELLTTLKSKVSVKKGKTKSLSTYVNAVSTDDVTYTSSNKKVATVNSKGVVKGKKKGTATITVTANGVKKKIKVTVK